MADCELRELWTKCGEGFEEGMSVDLRTVLDAETLEGGWCVC